MVPYAPGGPVDLSARLIAPKLQSALGQPVVVENKPGASGNIGTQAVAAAQPDGYTLLLGFDGTMVINPHVFAKVPFDTLYDFAPITKLGDATLILVAHPSLAVKNLAELVALARTRALAYGTSGTGGTPHLAGELLKQRTGAQLEHVPYKGGGQAITDVVGGQIPLVFTAMDKGTLYVRDASADRILYQSPIDKGQRIEVDPTANRVILDGRQVETAAPLQGRHCGQVPPVGS